MQTGSMINSIYGASRSPTPEVGMGVTVLYWTDRGAATVNEVVNEKTIRVVGDKSIRIDSNGMSDAQNYRYERGERYGIPGAGVVYTLRKNGRWVRRGDTMNGGQSIALGYRDTYHDYSF